MAFTIDNGYGVACIPLVIGIIAALYACYHTGRSLIIFDDDRQIILVTNTCCCFMCGDRRKLGPYHKFQKCKFHAQIPQFDKPENYDIHFVFDDKVESNYGGDKHLPFRKKRTVDDINKWWKKKLMESKPPSLVPLRIVTDGRDTSGSTVIEGDVDLI